MIVYKLTLKNRHIVELKYIYLINYFSGKTMFGSSNTEITKPYSELDIW